MGLACLHISIKQNQPMQNNMTINARASHRHRNIIRFHYCINRLLNFFWQRGELTCKRRWRRWRCWLFHVFRQRSQSSFQKVITKKTQLCLWKQGECTHAGSFTNKQSKRRKNLCSRWWWWRKWIHIFFPFLQKRSIKSKAKTSRRQFLTRKSTKIKQITHLWDTGFKTAHDILEPHILENSHKMESQIKMHLLTWTCVIVVTSCAAETAVRIRITR